MVHSKSWSQPGTHFPGGLGSGLSTSGSVLVPVPVSSLPHRTLSDADGENRAGIEQGSHLPMSANTFVGQGSGLSSLPGWSSLHLTGSVSTFILLSQMVLVETGP